MRKSVFFTVLLLAGAILAAASHFRTVSRLETRIKQLEEKVLTAHSQSETALAASKAARRSSGMGASVVNYDDSTLNGRIAEVEASVTELKHATDYLMERGQIPLAVRKIEELLAKLNDGSLPDNERLNALRLLRRDRSLNDAGMQTALGWLQASAVEGTKREILRALEGATNGLIKQPMIALAANDPNNGIREQAMENLQPFVNDPQVEQLMWDRLKTETDPRVRQEILEALSRGGATPERIASLQMRAQNPSASLDERLLALQALRRSQTDVQQIVASFAATAQTTQDAAVKAQIFNAFDGMSDPALKVPLVYGLQDADARVRARAADALSGYAADSSVRDWLRYVADNDPDSQVRREAQQALQPQQQQRGQGQQDYRR
ncbi:MAG: HEAT repeat domain-containing protein [Verrucomicrobiota bacterium]